MPIGAMSPEELETLLEDACLVGDLDALADLFEDDAVLGFPNRSQPVTGRGEITELINDLRAGGVTYLARRPAVVQTGSLALIINGAAVHVVRRSSSGWRYLISWLDSGWAIHGEA